MTLAAPVRCCAVRMCGYAIRMLLHRHACMCMIGVSLRIELPGGSGEKEVARKMLEAKGFPKEHYAQAESFSLGGGSAEALLAKQRCGPLADTRLTATAAAALESTMSLTHVHLPVGQVSSGAGCGHGNCWGRRVHTWGHVRTVKHDEVMTPSQQSAMRTRHS